MNYCVTRLLQDLSEKHLHVAHCGGISGILWGMQHLSRNGLIDIDPDTFAENDEALYELMISGLSAGRYDFLHEALGVALYFIDKLPDPTAEAYLADAVTALERLSVKVTGGISWPDHFTDKGRLPADMEVYNLGLAHGTPAILNILSMIYEKGICAGRLLPLIDQGVAWILSCRSTDTADFPALFPTIVNGSNEVISGKRSRLGWCYGDLGIAITLLNIGTRLKNNLYVKEAYAIFEHTLLHRDISNGVIMDASLCHGAMGVAHIFRRAYLLTGERIFWEGAEHWFHETLKFANWEDGPAGFKYYTADGYQSNHSLLEGLTGIGLGLIGNLDNNILPGWDRCLLIS